MLILSRKVDERILIAEDVWLRVMYIEGGRVGLGFDAPRDVRIVREEVLEASHDNAKLSTG